MAKLVAHVACEKCGAQAQSFDDGTVVCTRTAEAIAEAVSTAEKVRDKLIEQATAACEKSKKNVGEACGWKKGTIVTP